MEIYAAEQFLASPHRNISYILQCFSHYSYIYAAKRSYKRNMHSSRDDSYGCPLALKIPSLESSAESQIFIESSVIFEYSEEDVH
jgi:hypothetical protein